jgi:two-component system, NarL family, sensor histidine kinase DesK
VAGYRQPTLPSELRGAREMLAAAGIVFLRQGEPIALPPAAEAVLAWTVREGVTNVIRHSRARHCTIRLTQDADCVGVEVIDDGQGGCKETASSPAASVGGGHGLAGLSERVAAECGRFDAGPDPTGGFWLAVTVPVKRLAVEDDPSRTDTVADGEVARRPG